MPIDFNQDRWDKVKDAYDKWWDNKLERPIVAITVDGNDPGRTMPSAPVLTQATCADFTYSPDEIVDRLDYELSSQIFIGDAFPRVNLHTFGPGIISAFCGAVLDNSSGKVWFHPPEKMADISELHLEYDPNNKWLCRIKDICAAAIKRWNGNVIMGMPDFGMGLDLLAVFHTTEQLLLDLYDYPEEVKRILDEMDGLWIKYYTEIDSILQPVNPGYTDWLGIYSNKPAYVLQSDFSYMIGTHMFDEFTKPCLSHMCDTLDRSFYHLDGVGQLPHLDSLLEIDRLCGVQWVPGAGKPLLNQWPEVHRKIHSAGKKIHVSGMLNTLDDIGNQIGDFKSICFAGYGINDNPHELEQKLKAYGL